jgi:hypothetical protein
VLLILPNIGFKSSLRSQSGQEVIFDLLFLFTPFKNLAGIEQNLYRGRKGGGCNTPIFQNELSGEDATEDPVCTQSQFEYRKPLKI